MTWGIYEIVNIKTGYRYVGLSSRIEERWTEHRRLLNRIAHEQLELQKAWINDGEECFDFRILQKLPVGTPNARMHARERFWLYQHRNRLYNNKRLGPDRSNKTKETPASAMWPYVPEKPFIPRRHHLGPPAGMKERRVVMYSGRRDHIRLAEIQNQKART